MIIFFCGKHTWSTSCVTSLYFEWESNYFMYFTGKCPTSWRIKCVMGQQLMTLTVMHWIWAPLHQVPALVNPGSVTNLLLERGYRASMFWTLLIIKSFDIWLYLFEKDTYYFSTIEVASYFICFRASAIWYTYSRHYISHSPLIFSPPGISTWQFVPFLPNF